jgi:hypothetical protein
MKEVFIADSKEKYIDKSDAKRTVLNQKQNKSFQNNHD